MKACFASVFTRLQVAINVESRGRFILLVLIVFCVLSATIIVVFKSIDELSFTSPHFCNLVPNDHKIIMATLAPTVRHCSLRRSSQYNLQFSTELASVDLVLYVMITNRRLRRKFVHNERLNQTLPIRVSIRRNINIASALLPSALLHALRYGIGYSVAVVLYLHSGGSLLPTDHVRLAKLKCTGFLLQFLYTKLLPRFFGNLCRTAHPYIVIILLQRRGHNVLLPTCDCC